MAYNSSTAYDLSLYTSTAPKTRPKKQPELKVVHDRSDKRSLSYAFTPKSLGAFAIVVTLVSLMIYNHVLLTEITGEINGLRGELVELNSEHVKLNSEMEAMASLRTVEEEAKAMGMTRLDVYNTHHVNLYGEDQIHMGEQASNKGIVTRARTLIDGVLEYIPGR